MTKQGSVFPWSYSSLSTYEQCPRKFYHLRIAKDVKDTMGEAALWGNRVHKALELAVKGTQALPPELAKYNGIVEALRSAPGQKFTEQKFGLTVHHTPTTFFGKDVWFRGIIDLKIVGKKNAICLDWKTGRVKTDGDQLKLFAATAFAQHPHVQEVHTKYVWLKHDQTTGKKFKREHLPAIWKSFEPRLERMKRAEDKDRWLPNESPLCNWCPVGPDKCEFWRGYHGEG